MYKGNLKHESIFNAYGMSCKYWRLFFQCFNFSSKNSIITGLRKLSLTGEDKTIQNLFNVSTMYCASGQN